MLNAVRSQEQVIPVSNDSGERSRYFDRDLSLLEFFRRVLDEGDDVGLPLLERLKFLAILSSNIDEFFMVRVPRLKEKREGPRSIGHEGRSFAEVLSEVRRKVRAMVERQSRCLRDDLLPRLRAEGIDLAALHDLPPAEREALDLYFERQIRPVLTPQAVDPTHPFPLISNGSLNIGLFIRPNLPAKTAKLLRDHHDRFFVAIQIPDFLPRFVPVGGSESRFVLIEELIKANIAKITPNAVPEDCHLFRPTRDAAIELREYEADDLLVMMEENLKERRFAGVERLEVAESTPAAMVDYLKERFALEDEAVYFVPEPMNISDFWALVGLDRPDLKSPPITPRVPDVLRSRKKSYFDLIAGKDILLHHPYNPYSVVTDLIRSAAEDEDVLAIKICLYRIGADSPIANALIAASEKGKQVTALVEIKARFDEANNIGWCRRLEEAGVHVIYGLLGLKTHAKTTLIVRREGGELKSYVHLATGNYNPDTSTVYTDLGLLTADEEIGADVSGLFNYLTVYTEPTTIKKLLIAPLNLRERMRELIHREIENANAGRPARIIAKINRLADPEIVNTLYAASRAGVSIDLIVRGICTLRPGVPGMSENIRVRSVVGRLLEHSRVYYFENGGDGEVYIGSSDWMPRNLDRRVEVLAPVRDESIGQFLRYVYLETYLRDDVKARELNPDGSHSPAARSGEGLDAQAYFQNRPDGSI